MSRIVNYTTAVTLTPVGYQDGTYAFTTSTQYPLTNAYTDSSSTSYGRLTLGSTTNRQYQIYFDFDSDALSSIPNGATINSVTGSVKYAINNTGTTRISSMAIQLYSNTTAMGTANGKPSNTYATTATLTAGTWTLAQVRNMRLSVSATMGSSTRTARVDFYGANVTINYTVNGVAYEVNVSDTSTAATVTPTYFSGFAGSTSVISITGINNLDGIVVKDNGVDVNSQLERSTTSSHSVDLIPSSLDSSNGTVSNTQNGLSDTSSTSYAEVRAGTNYYLMYAFDVSSIPSTATINSVSCSVKAECTRTYSAAGSAQLYTGSTAKGSSYTFGSTATVFDLTTGTWTRNELNDIKIRIGSTYTGNNTYYSRFYGAELTINYTVNEVSYTYTLSNISADHTIVVSDIVHYTVEAVSTTDAATVSPSTQTLEAGEDAEVRIDTDDIDTIIVSDNGDDVTSQLNYVIPSSTGNDSAVLGEYNLISGGFYSGESYFEGLVGKGENGSTTTSNYYSQGSSTIAVFTYDLVFDNIPSNATITRLYARVNGHAESTSQSNEYMCAQLILDTTGNTISNELNFKSVGTSNSTQTVEATTLPTVSQLSGLKLKCRLGYYGGAINGATCYVEYTLPSNPYYVYTIENISDDHDIVVEDAVTKHQITASSTFNGVHITPTSTMVVEGNMAEFTIDSQNTYSIKLLDNGVNVTSNITGSAGNYKYRLQNVTSAHTLVLSEATYYTVTGSSTYTGATVSAPGKVYAWQNATVTVSVGNKYEIVFKDNNVDKTSSLAGSTGTLTYTLTNVQANHTIAVSEATNYTITTSSSYNGVTVTANPTKVYAGRSCTVTIAGASKDTMTVKDNNTDVTSSLVGSNTTYTYTISSVVASHTVTVEEKPAVTYQVNASSTYSRATITPTASTVVEGDTLVLTITGDVVPIKVTDNNTDVTASLVTNGSSRTYTLTNITTAHTIVVSFVQTALVRTSSGYVAGKKFYKKTAASTWTEMTLSEFQSYIQSNQTFYE